MVTGRRPVPPNPRRPPARPGGGLVDTIRWTQTLEQPDLYALRYDDDVEERTVELKRLVEDRGTKYLGVVHAGKFKSLRADKVRTVRQLTANHPQLIRVQPTYFDLLPPWPGEPLSLRIPQTKGNRTWGVELGGLYYCACPEKRQRAGLGYELPQLGAVCSHLARAIGENLPVRLPPAWTEDLRDFLSNPRLIALENLV